MWVGHLGCGFGQLGYGLDIWALGLAVELWVGQRGCGLDTWAVGWTTGLWVGYLGFGLGS